MPDGCYLVRESQNRVGQYSIDVKFNFLVKHLKVNIFICFIFNFNCIDLN